MCSLILLVVAIIPLPVSNATILHPQLIAMTPHVPVLTVVLVALVVKVFSRVWGRLVGSNYDISCSHF